MACTFILAKHTFEINNKNLTKVLFIFKFVKISLKV